MKLKEDWVEMIMKMMRTETWTMRKKKPKVKRVNCTSKSLKGKNKEKRQKYWRFPKKDKPYWSDKYKGESKKITNGAKTKTFENTWMK